MIAIVIPAYNEAATVAQVVQAVLPFGRPIVVDDCSNDRTGELARAAGAEVVRHDANRGYDGALQSGFEAADRLGAAIVVTFDADGQHEPSMIARLSAPILAGEAQLVLGQRPQPARLSEWVFDLYTRWRFGVPDILCGLKAYAIALYRRHGRFDGTSSIGTELALVALRSGLPHRLVPVPIHDRAGRPRFGSLLRANARIFRAFAFAVAADIRQTATGRGGLDRSMA